MLEVARIRETNVQNRFFLSGNLLENGSVEDLSFGWEEGMKNRLMEIDSDKDNLKELAEGQIRDISWFNILSV